jgi:hypothetical protein
MKTTLIKMPIVSYRRIENPFEQEEKRMYVAVIQAKNLSRDLDEWRKINPVLNRQANLARLLKIGRYRS